MRASLAGSSTTLTLDALPLHSDGDDCCQSVFTFGTGTHARVSGPAPMISTLVTTSNVRQGPSVGANARDCAYASPGSAVTTGTMPAVVRK